jgi:prepilin-type N-terminal cleavage/methylation domain-containing protein
MMKFFTQGVRGFTLIELLVVIAIIGILSSIVLASLNTARLKSRDARRVADLKQVQLAMQLYYDANSSYPTSTGALAPTFIATIPTDPVGQVAYPYDQLSSGASYHIGANLEDSSNQALQSDLDSVSTNINGADTGDCAGSTTSGRRCYDVGP